MRSIEEIRPFQNEFEVFFLPACRVVGYEMRVGLKVAGSKNNPIPAFVNAHLSTDGWRALTAREILIPDAGLGWTCDYKQEDDTFSYIMSVFLPAGASVPEGCRFRDVPEGLVAKGLFGDTIGKVVQRAKAAGYETAWDVPGLGFNAELYLDAEMNNPPAKPNREGCRHLVPVKEIKK